MVYYSREQHKALLLRTLCIALLCCAGTLLQAQVYYSVNPKYIRSKTEWNNLLSDYKYNYPDTSITEQINFFPRNFMGNLGLPSPNYIWRYGTDNIGFRMVQPPLTNDKIREKEVQYIRSMGPYASLTGVAGSKEFQVLKMIFTHTYRDKVNFTIGFNRYTSKGFYQKQQTFTDNFFLSSNYTTKKKRFGYYFYMLSNGNKNQENGGIADRVLTDSSVIYSKELFKVRLASASRDNRELKVMANPWFRLNRSDSGKIDHYIQLKARFSNNMYRYRDPYDTSMIYKNFYLDTLVTNDSAKVSQFNNEVNYSLLTKNGSFGFSAGYRNEISYVWQKVDSLFMNHILQSDLVYRKKLAAKDSLDKTERSLETRLNLQYALQGPLSGNVKVESNSLFTFQEAKKRQLYLDVLFENRSPDYIYNNWVSNHFLWWNNGFKEQQEVQAKLGLRLNRLLHASVFYRNINNYLYFDQQALPKQSSSAVSLLGLDLNFNKVFFKHLGVGLHHIFQNTSSALVRAPRNITTAKLYYTGRFTRNIFQVQIGAQVQLYESFTPYDYMPSTQVFYLANTRKTENFPYLDVYLSARIRPVSFFVKVENVLAGIAGPDYYLVPGYYQTDLALRFGLTWMFFD